MFRLIGKFLHWIWSGLDGLRKVLHLLLLLVIFGILWAAFSRSIPLVPDKAALVIAPQGPLVEQLSGDPLERALAESLRQAPVETLLRDVVDAIESAAGDERISALYLDLSGMERGGLAKLQEVARAIDTFRESGKPVIAYGDFYDQPHYYLAAHADEIYLDPQGIVYIDGFANYGLFVKDALDKLAIDWNIFRVGEYKSAVETFTRNDMSPEEREASLLWLGTLWGTYKGDVAKARGFEPQVLQSYADDAVEGLRRAEGSLARMALDAGLVTGLEGRFAVEERLAEITGEDDNGGIYVGVDHDAYLANVRSQEALSREPADVVAVIVAAGEILPGEQPPGMIGSDTLAWQLRDAREDEAVKAVVLRIDSPGGSVFASEVIRREVAALREAGKPVVASMSSLAASGGYYIAMDCDRIVASPATLTGSIGIFAMFPTFQRTMEKLGVRSDGVGTTALSGEFRGDRPLGEVSREILQQSIEYEYRQFIGHVAESRKKTVEQVDAVAQGRVWAGADAHELGLVDELGGYRDAIELAAELAKLGEDYSVDYPEAQGGLGDVLGLRIRAGVASLVAPLLPESVLPRLPAALSPLVAEARRLARLADPRSLYAYCLACSVD
jgi:protease-4